MNPQFKTAIRTVLTYFPQLEETKVFLQRLFQNTLRIPFEPDFDALRFFPNIAGALYLDIGGHRGFATEAILARAPQSRVGVFEPNPVLAERLQRRFASHPRVEVFHAGLGDLAGELRLYLPIYRGYTYYGLASFDRTRAESWLQRNGIFFYDPRWLEIREHTCPVWRLDDLKLEPFFMKLDVQGYEPRVLQGGEETIRAHRPILLIEGVTKGGQVMRFLDPMGYKLYSYDPKARRLLSDPLRPGNMFLMTDEKRRMLAI